MGNDCICLACPNGCHLVWKARDDGGIALTGQGCDRGGEFVRSLDMTRANQHTHCHAGLDPASSPVLDSLSRPGHRSGTGGNDGIGIDDGLSDHEDRDGSVLPERPSACDDDTLAEIAALWGISVAAVDRKLIPAGSPERTLFRTVIEDSRGKRFIVERIPPAALYRKLRIIRALAFLAEKGLAGVAPYCECPDSKPIRRHGGGLWQLAPYVPGVLLDRETYLYEGWRAAILADFLIDLRATSREIPFFAPEEVFSLKGYIRTLVSRIECHTPAIMSRLTPVLAFLEQGFMEAHDWLPAGFCHGDYHPLNIVWGDRGIRAVIDWEFCGHKPEAYDLANMVGCLGIEHPTSLVGELVTGLIARLKASGLFSEISWAHFPALVVALRFAWLSEWLRKNDAEMIGLELDYLELLVGNRERLSRQWGF